MVVALIAISVISSGCATWNGVKQDSNEAWDSTKGAIHKATE